MKSRREEIADRMVDERSRNSNLPGSETDVKKRANDWVATIVSYLGEATERNGLAPTREDYEDGLIKAGAVILAALEFSEFMHSNKTLR